ncbi:hypothetical protein [Spirosoma rigui]|uniref:hypothetical protein n=1 Tax=Spirosoma rigui TaxID=564064 RepID=UPI0009AFFE6E|nr:hypothetical protein [Spirosoma rigui]
MAKRTSRIKIKLSLATGLQTMRFAFGERSIVISAGGSYVEENDVKAIEAQFPNWTDRVTAKADAPKDMADKV